jgi:hypothetical protein
MLAKLKTFSLLGIDALPVEVAKPRGDELGHGMFPSLKDV